MWDGTVNKCMIMPGYLQYSSNPFPASFHKSNESRKYIEVISYQIISSAKFRAQRSNSVVLYAAAHAAHPVVLLINLPLAAHAAMQASGPAFEPVPTGGIL